MGKISIREMSSVGDSYSEVEYIFEDSSDYFAFEELKYERLNNAVKSFVAQAEDYDYPDDLKVKILKH